MNSEPSECAELIDLVTGKVLTDPMKRTYGGRICGGLKLPTAMYCDDCKADIARESKDVTLGNADVPAGTGERNE